jgi:predicted phosphodiesterase
MIFFCGDPHGNFGHIEEVVVRHRPDAIVLLGDIEAQRPLEQELRTVLNKTEIWWIPGNHDTDSHANYDNLFGSALADRNLHRRVVEIAGLKVAGLGGVFRESIWYPRRSAEVEPAVYDNYADYLKRSEPGSVYAAAQRRGLPKGAKMSEAVAAGKLLTHRSSIFYDDWLSLFSQRADILVTHEAPSCHPNGFVAIDELARALRAKASFHGHHHDRLNYETQWENLGFQAHGVGFCGVTDQHGGLVRIGEFDNQRDKRRGYRQ